MIGKDSMGWHDLAYCINFRVLEYQHSSSIENLNLCRFHCARGVARLSASGDSDRACSLPALRSSFGVFAFQHCKGADPFVALCFITSAVLFVYVTPVFPAGHIYSILTANFRAGKCVCFFFCFSVTRLASFLLRRRRIARVCFGRRSSGRYFFFA